MWGRIENGMILGRACGSKRDGGVGEKGAGGEGVVKEG